VYVIAPVVEDSVESPNVTDHETPEGRPDSVNVTEYGTGADATIVIRTGALCCVTPSSVAFTNSVSVPAVVPAVNVTLDPELAFKVPRVSVRFQE
jgi:hypothetical protein